MGIGAAIMLFASRISRHKTYKKWEKYIQQNNLEDTIRSSVSAAMQLYDTYQCRQTKNYISKLNPDAAAILEFRSAKNNFHFMKTAP